MLQRCSHSLGVVPEEHPNSPSVQLSDARAQTAATASARRRLTFPQAAAQALSSVTTAPVAETKLPVIRSLMAIRVFDDEHEALVCPGGPHGEWRKVSLALLRSFASSTALSELHPATRLLQTCDVRRLRKELVIVSKWWHAECFNVDLITTDAFHVSLRCWAPHSQSLALTSPGKQVVQADSPSCSASGSCLVLVLEGELISDDEQASYHALHTGDVKHFANEGRLANTSRSAAISLHVCTYPRSGK